MTDPEANKPVSRRGFLRGAAGAAAVAGAAGTATAQSEPDYDGWLDDVGNYDSTVDKTGQEEVTITVGAKGNNGNFAFGPAAVKVDPGTKVIWEWNGKGGSHNVVAEEGGDFESELVGEAGHTFEQTFDENGLVTYYCQPHKSLGMKGAVVVGEVSTGGGESGGSAKATLPSNAKTMGIATTSTMVLTLGLAYFFLKYGGDYGDLD